MPSARALLPALLAACAAPSVDPEARPVWRRLFDGTSLDGWEPTAFGGGGSVELDGGRLVLDFGSPLTGVTWRGGELPRIDYEIELEAARLAGTDFFCALTFPVGAEHASLVLGGWGGSLCGISCIDGEDAAHNETERHIGFRAGVVQRVRLRVTAGRIRAWLADEELVDLPIAGRELAVRPELAPSRPLGIASYATRAAITAVRIRCLGPAPAAGAPRDQASAKAASTFFCSSPDSYISSTMSEPPSSSPPTKTCGVVGQP